MEEIHVCEQCGKKMWGSDGGAKIVVHVFGMDFFFCSAEHEIKWLDAHNRKFVANKQIAP